MMQDEAFLTFLKKHYPYLYEVEMEVRRIVDKSGFGDVSMVMKIQQNKVRYLEFINAAKIKFGVQDFT